MRISLGVFCSILTPLVGLQVLALERNYELTIGANIGTTITALLASMTQAGLYFRQSVQIALTHLFFNLSGCLLWYVVPYFRRLPIDISRQIGSIVSEYRWFALVYILTIFFLLPLIILLLALIHWIVAIVFLLIVLIFLILIILINHLQKTNANRLPLLLRSWTFLPRSCRSLAYWDHRLENCLKRICCQRCIRLIYPSNNFDKPLKEQYLSMKDQYLTALDHRFLSHTRQLNQLFEKHHAPIISIYESRYPITYYVQDFYRSLAGKPTPGEKNLSILKQMHNNENNDDDANEELIDRIIVFDREKTKATSVTKQMSSLSF